MVKITKTNGEEKVIFKNGVMEIVDSSKVKTIKMPDGKEVRRGWKWIYLFNDYSSFWRKYSTQITTSSPHRSHRGIFSDRWWSSDLLSEMRRKICFGKVYLSFGIELCVHVFFRLFGDKFTCLEERNQENPPTLVMLARTIPRFAFARQGSDGAREEGYSERVPHVIDERGVDEWTDLLVGSFSSLAKVKAFT